MLGNLLDSPIAFHRCLASLAGSVAGGVMLSQAMYWTKRSSAGDGWFYKTQEEWEEETMLSRYEQEGIRKRLRTTAFWKEDLRGVPAKLFYRIDMQELRLALQTSLRKNPKLASGKTTNKLGENQQALLLTETTSETTSETTKKEKANTRHVRVALPDWLPEKDWKDFCEMRQRIRAPLTEAGKEKIIKKLEAMRARGHDPLEVLSRSVENSWRGVFERDEKPQESLVEQRQKLEKKYGIG